MMKRLELNFMNESFGIITIDGGKGVPKWVFSNEFYTILDDENEKKIICYEKNIPEDVGYEGDWKCIKLGVNDIDNNKEATVIYEALMELGVDVFLIETADYEYVFIKEKQLIKSLNNVLGSENFVMNSIS